MLKTGCRAGAAAAGSGSLRRSSTLRPGVRPSLVTDASTRRRRLRNPAPCSPARKPEASVPRRSTSLIIGSPSILTDHRHIIRCSTICLPKCGTVAAPFPRKRPKPRDECRTAALTSQNEPSGTDMKHGVSRDLYNYWNALRAGRTAPERGDIDPAAIRHVLAYTFILEVSTGTMSQAREVTFRLSGTRLNALFQRDLKGRPFSEIWLPEEAALAEHRLERCPRRSRRYRCGRRGVARAGYEAVAFEMMLLPLRHHGKTHARLLGSIAASVAPTWIGLYPIEGLEIRSFHHILQVPALEAPDRFGFASARPASGRPGCETARTCRRHAGRCVHGLRRRTTPAAAGRRVRPHVPARIQPPLTGWPYGRDSPSCPHGKWNPGGLVPADPRRSPQQRAPSQSARAGRSARPLHVGKPAGVSLPDRRHVAGRCRHDRARQRRHAASA